MQQAEKDVDRIGSTAARTDLPALVAGTRLAGPRDLVNATEAQREVVAALADLLTHRCPLRRWVEDERMKKKRKKKRERERGDLTMQ